MLIIIVLAGGYTSNDGLTYTRNGAPTISNRQTGSNYVTFNYDDTTKVVSMSSNSRIYYYYDEKNDVLSQFLKLLKPTYDGLYTLNHTDDTSYRQYSVNINTLKTNGLPEELDLCHLYYSDDRCSFGINPTIITRQGQTVIEFEEQLSLDIGSPLVFKDGNIYRIGFVTKDLQKYHTQTYIRKYNKHTGTSTSVTKEVVDYDIATLPYWDYGDLTYYYYFFELYNTTDLSNVCIIHGSTAIWAELKYTESPSGSSYTTTTYNIDTPKQTSYTTFVDAILVDMQFTATADEVYSDYVFYGKNGAQIGTLGVVDNTFATSTARLFRDTQQQYNEMTPRILTDQDKNIDKNIYIIPTKIDGTPLLDTSRVTNMSSMFMNCKNLIAIPLLDTSNATNMFRICYQCENLVDLPLLDTNVTTSLSGAFYMCTKLSDESLNNILAMCTNAVGITENKTLKNLSLTQAQATKCTTLSNYQAFVNAGWTTGY